MKKISITVCAMMLAMNCVSPASPVIWKVSSGGNGHFYESIQCGKLTWNDADAAARASSYKGVQGNLVTFNSQAELKFIANSFLDGWGVWWVGASLDASDAANMINSEGPVNSFLNKQWYWGEPVKGNYGVAVLGNSYTDRFKWSGPLCTKPAASNECDAYIVEYAVPEPTTLALLGFGGLALLRRRRKM